MDIKDVMPRVAIDRIIVESNVQRESTEENPHIDHIREPHTYKDEATGKILRETPDKILEDYKKQQENLCVSVSVKVNALQNDILSVAFGGKNLSKYFSVRVFQVLDDDTYEKILKSKNIFQLDKNSPGKYTSRDRSCDGVVFSQDASGGYFTETFDVAARSVKYLSYIVIVFIDISQLYYDFGLGATGINGVQGGLDSVVVMKDGEISLVSHIIQDMRLRNTIEKNSLSFTATNNDLLQQVFSSTTERPMVYFTDFWTSRDKLGKVRFIFGIDMSAMAENLTQLNIINEKNSTEMLKNFPILSMKIKRRRVSNEKDVEVLFDENDPYDLIVQHGEHDAYTFGSSAEYASGNIKEVSIYDGESGMRYFTGMDKGMSSISYGIYRYEVEIDIEDKTVMYLEDATNNLVNAYEVFKLYYNEVLFGQNFDIYSGKFNDDFVAEQLNKYKTSSPWDMAIASYLRVYSLMVRDFDVRKYAKLLLGYAHPRVGSVDGCDMLLKLMENLIKRMFEVVGGYPDDNAFNSQGVKKVSARKRIIHLENIFDSVFDSDIPKKNGYVFIEEDVDSQNSLVGISKKNYENRLEMEKMKYFGDSVPATVGALEASYITPESVIVDDVKLYVPDATHLDLEHIYSKIVKWNGVETVSQEIAKPALALVETDKYLGIGTKFVERNKSETYKESADTKKKEAEMFWSKLLKRSGGGGIVSG